MRYVVDASVITKMLAREAGSKTAQNVLAAAVKNQVTLIALSVLIYEVGIALTRKGFRARTMREKMHALTAMSQVDLIEIVEVDADLLFQSSQMALEISGNAERPWFNDCIYYQLAEREQATLLTAGGKFMQRLQKFTRFQTSVVLLNDVKTS